MREKTQDYWNGFHRALTLVEQEADAWVKKQAYTGDAAMTGLRVSQFTTNVRITADELADEDEAE